MTWHTGGLIDHVHPVVADLGTSNRFHAAEAEVLGLGKNIEAVCHGPPKRSAASVEMEPG